MAGSEQEWITLALIVRPQGRRGEVLAELFTDFPELFISSPGLVLVSPAGDRRSAAIESQWLPTGRSKGRVVLKLAGIEGISDAEALAGYKVQIPKTQRVALDSETYYVSDLIGCTLLDDDVPLGTISDVQFPVNADGHRLQDSAPLFILGREDGGEVLIPFARAFVRRIDIDSRQVFMTLPAGLLDLNA